MRDEARDIDGHRGLVQRASEVATQFTDWQGAVFQMVVASDGRYWSQVPETVSVLRELESLGVVVVEADGKTFCLTELGKEICLYAVMVGLLDLQRREKR
jgi:hypothetical protein